MFLFSQFVPLFLAFVTLPNNFLSKTRSFLFSQTFFTFFTFFFSFFFVLFFTMKTFYLAFAVIFCVALTAIAEEENDIIFRALIENLCQANRLGAYGSCCDENSNGTTVTVSSLAYCFGYVSVTASEINSLFVLILTLHLYLFFHFLSTGLSQVKD